MKNDCVCWLNNHCVFSDEVNYACPDKLEACPYYEPRYKEVKIHSFLVDKKEC